MVLAAEKMMISRLGSTVCGDSSTLLCKMASKVYGVPDCIASMQLGRNAYDVCTFLHNCP